MIISIVLAVVSFTLAVLGALALEFGSDPHGWTVLAHWFSGLGAGAALSASIGYRLRDGDR